MIEFFRVKFKISDTMPESKFAILLRHRDNLNLDSTHQAGQVRNKGRSTGEHREPQADVEQQGCETPPHKPGHPAGLREGLAQALEASLAEGSCELLQQINNMATSDLPVEKIKVRNKYNEPLLTMSIHLPHPRR